jgi:hypothetical protein
VVPEVRFVALEQLDGQVTVLSVALLGERQTDTGREREREREG